MEDISSEDKISSYDISSEDEISSYDCNVRYFSQEWIFHKVTNHWLDTTHSTQKQCQTD